MCFTLNLQTTLSGKCSYNTISILNTKKNDNEFQPKDVHKGTELVNSTVRNGTEVFQDSEGLLSYVICPYKHSQVNICVQNVYQGMLSETTCFCEGVRTEQRKNLHLAEFSTEALTNPMGTSGAAMAPRVALNGGREPSLGTSHQSVTECGLP